MKEKTNRKQNKSPKIKRAKPPKQTSIGGQAVIEGVMMRGKTAMATAVRDEEGNIRLESKRLTPPEKKPRIARLPIIRGMISYVESLFSGTKILMRSAEVYGETEEPTKFEKWTAEKLHVDVMSVVLVIATLLGIALSVGLFIVLPQLAANGISKLVDYLGGSLPVAGVWYNLIEGLVRIIIFVCYILLTSLTKSVRRIYMYHGAEHKTINCFESGKELTVENARASSRLHNRCGTTFMFFVMLISILVFSLVNSVLGLTNKFVIILVKMALMFTVVSGLSYELLKGLAKTDNPIFFPLKAPGLLLQKITTREPDDGMLEVAITAFNAVREMDADQTIPEKQFVTCLKTCDLLSKVDEILKNGKNYEKSDGEWIVSLVTGIKRSAVTSDKTIIKPAKVDVALCYAEQRAKGRPLCYVIGDCDFYGYNIKTDERALIPRPETEELCAFALEILTSNDKVLDLCTGSGAIAITLALKSGASVDASDISVDALSLAEENAKDLNADVKFIESDMFEKITDKYSVIISNPPYIPNADVDTLEETVKDYEPRLALSGGDDGLDFYRIIATKAQSRLYDGGALFLEVGIGQAEQVAEMLKNAGFASVEIKKDISGIERMIKAIK